MKALTSYQVGVDWAADSPGILSKFKPAFPCCPACRFDWADFLKPDGDVHTVGMIIENIKVTESIRYNVCERCGATKLQRLTDDVPQVELNEEQLLFFINRMMEYRATVLGIEYKPVTDSYAGRLGNKDDDDDRLDSIAQAAIEVARKILGSYEND